MDRAKIEEVAAHIMIHLGTDSIIHVLKAIDRACVVFAMRECQGNCTHAANRLNVCRPTLVMKRKSYGLPMTQYNYRERKYENARSDT